MAKENNKRKLKPSSVAILIIIGLLAGSVATYFIRGTNTVTTTTTQVSTSTTTVGSTQTISTAITNVAVQTTSTTLTSTQIQATTSIRTVVPAGNVPVISSMSFNDNKALGYFSALNTTTGLLRDYQNDSHIFLADDQALDYNALIDIYASTGNTTALQLATQINKTMSQQYGGLYQYWNDVFVLFRHYPSTTEWNVSTGSAQSFPNESGFTIEATVFPTNTSHPIEIKQYADIAIYYAIWCLDVASIPRSGGNLSEASDVFNAVQTECINYGCEDAGYFSPSVPSTVVFSSYKVALDLIAYKEMLAAGAFNLIDTLQVNETINNLLYVANQLQAPDGGVYTQYNAYGANIVPFGLGSFSSENGETTALFALAYYLWDNGSLA